MKIVIINGQNHKGNTQRIARTLAKKGNTGEAFLTGVVVFYRCVQNAAKRSRFSSPTLFCRVKCRSPRSAIISLCLLFFCRVKRRNPRSAIISLCLLSLSAKRK